ncbi:carboxymuconolactone decarboxylase family protein [Granulosicoccus antarcticus]|uniref:Carboxymuconolactone decarboxylase-like domain-containing protein n=1 Tax=Granulosicoccus antarcticus IMCC3135 TaxID=1192854 RepID=A0A2Z2NNU6_9GAMM|nr:carboxymuconolactone decarboxylase family protein [Granulosicoccus antarcticus]ASJ72899.1 hypothetical protein IMCC3135_14070 [Granulosicoccus antarcticus IMCC3135]
MARITPLDIDDIPEELAPAVQTYQTKMGKVPNSFRTMARKPLIAKAYGDFQKALAASLTIPAELRSMMFLLQSQSNGCLYCQAHSVSALARDNNVSEEKIKDLWLFDTSPVFSEAERVALQFALQASQHPNAATDADFDALKLHYSEDQIVELVAVLSIGSFLNTWNDTMATQLEEASAKTAEEQLGHRGWKIGKHA